MQRRTFIKSILIAGISQSVLEADESSENSREKITLAQLCDPQLGFGKDGFDADVARLKREIEMVNELKPDVVLFAGDMVNNVADEKSVKTFLKLVAEIKPPVMLTAGNHDLPDPVTDEGLKRYRNYFGQDFSPRECKGHLIVSANSQLWRAAVQEEQDKHERLFRDALQSAKRREMPVILLTHVPPFVKSIDEKDEYFNLPRSKRTELLQLCESSGVVVWLAGHTHRTAKRNYNNIAILNGETTSQNFDQHPFGFRLLTIYPDKKFDWEFQKLKD
ncbi:MAG: metallophosphoesterase [Planctomycetaceae bacterium]|nr:metallophosphoesterase [Planctomycetaceae bacterium]